MFLSYSAGGAMPWPRQVAAAQLIPILLFLLCFAEGCTAPKHSWHQWAKAANGSPSQAAPLNLLGLPPDIRPPLLRPPYQLGDGATAGPKFDLAARNPGFPATYIAAVLVDLTAPGNRLHLVWAGPDARFGPMGPWRSSAGRGRLGLDCDEVAQSNTVDSWCTPKGVFPVAGFDDHLECSPSCRYVTWVIYEPRFIAIHSHTEIPPYPASHGCVRVPLDVAKLIHNNSLVGVTRIHVYGKWTRAGGLLK